jgi:CheY-like chemotaxis protein
MKQYRIFTVEDDVDDRDFLREAFEENGCVEELLHFFSCKAFLQYINTVPDEILPHLIILENSIQGQNSIETVDCIKNNPRLAHIKMAIYTDSLQGKVKTEYMDRGVNLCMEKGNNMRALKEDVASFYLLMEEK